jgi:hypothetical protein
MVEAAVVAGTYYLPLLLLLVGQTRTPGDKNSLSILVADVCGGFCGTNSCARGENCIEGILIVWSRVPVNEISYSVLIGQAGNFTKTTFPRE